MRLRSAHRWFGRPVAAVLLVVSVWFAGTTAYGSVEAIDFALGAAQMVRPAVHQPWALGLSTTAGVRMSLDRHWWLRLGIGWQRFWDDTTSARFFKFPHPDSRSRQAWTQAALSVDAARFIGNPDGLAPYVGAGVGLSTWRIDSYPDYHVVELPDGSGRIHRVRANELFASLLAGVDPPLSRALRLHVGLGFSYLSGVAADIPEPAGSPRPRAQVSLTVGITVPLGPSPWRVRPEPRAHQSAQSLQPGAWHDSSRTSREEPTGSGDADADGVADAVDRCPGTPAGAVVDRFGCPLDSDSDGVYDGIDRCPGTPASERNLVDAYGCSPSQQGSEPEGNLPVFGPKTPAELSSPEADADSDGVPDLRDRCPGTPKGMEVDSSGCLVMTQLDRRLILHVVYVSGTSEPDPLSVRILNDLAVRLKGSPGMRATVEGFTDDVGEAEANLRLSQKRANKIKTYLVGCGIPAARIQAIGRGETKFIADNATALGRRSNRRIEISFHPAP